MLPQKHIKGRMVTVPWSSYKKKKSSNNLFVWFLLLATGFVGGVGDKPLQDSWLCPLLSSLESSGLQFHGLPETEHLQSRRSQEEAGGELRMSFPTSTSLDPEPRPACPQPLKSASDSSNLESRHFSSHVLLLVPPNLSSSEPGILASPPLGSCPGSRAVPVSC